MKRKKFNTKLEEFLTNLDIDIDIVYYIDIDDVNDYDDIYQAIDDNNGFDVEVIYYYEAMKYLSEHDPSLSESMGLASDMGF